LLLVDYIERHGTLVHDASAAASLGEMAHYTPGVHLLAVTAGAISRTTGFQALYTVVAVSVALKFGLFALCLLRLFNGLGARLPLAIGGIALVFLASQYTLGSFIHDSFLAQTVGELFAIVMWWTLIVWNDKPSSWSMVTYGASGLATFLTWPVWIGPPVVALAILLLTRRDLDAQQRLRQASIALLPVAVIATLYTIGRAEGLGLVRTSGAVALPPWSPLGWGLLALAVLGLVSSAAMPSSRALLALIAALGLQAAALWAVAEWNGAATPYMAIKMLYLAAYPLIAAAMIAVGRVTARPVWTTVAVLTIGIVAARHVAAIPRPLPIVSTDLWTAGQWARSHVPRECVDYLVGNEYTAYWLHLAVLGNPRAAARSTNNDTYLTEPSFARWIADAGGPPYAIALWSALPREIRDRVKTLYRAGDVAVIARSASCQQAGQRAIGEPSSLTNERIGATRLGGVRFGHFEKGGGSVRQRSVLAPDDADRAFERELWHPHPHQIAARDLFLHRNAGQECDSVARGDEALDGIDGRHLNRHLQQDPTFLKRLDDLGAVGRCHVMRHERLAS
jgi:hypothetical protein